ncbi:MULTISPECIES: tetratricopeptide repeat protein [Pontibacillus]|uniref:Tetratricopeptide repeat protein n=1 Tax=Pontibacillus chungwhensis TaxID=265426 RepID=A0ABY8V1L3_9BACI|nr:MULTISPECIES: tetratricopeptide repeat protein [Pontibacillus]MCD5325383.1 hypothetical protein [Pontibacillus sp. HN14]WIF98500.1 tetratricopeptide repeat protein [Pontibacillus chungwhensis]
METIQQLTQQLHDWENMQGIDEEEEEQEWIGAGIALYEKIIKVDKENKSDYLQELSRLYLNYGRNEKMKFSNFTRAVRHLKQAVYIDPEDPRPCYHLSFLLMRQDHPEGALFYAERALKLGLDDKQTYKLFCNMALGYYKLLLLKESYGYLLKVEEKAKQDPVLGAFLKPYQATIKGSKKKGYVPLSEQHGTIVETEDELEDRVSGGECVVLMIHPYRTELNGEEECVSFSSVNAQILEAILLSEGGLTVTQISGVLWGYNAVEMSPSYVPRMMNKIRSDLKKATGIDGKKLLKTDGNLYVWDHTILKGNIHYKNHKRSGSRSREGITIL